MPEFKTYSNDVIQYEVYETVLDGNPQKRVKMHLPFAIQKKGEDTDVIDFCVDKDPEGHEYFHIPHIQNLKENKLPIFNGRPADAINMVKHGGADALLSRGIFQNWLDLRPIKFVDEEVGKRMKAQTLEGWVSEVKYKYTLTKSYKASFSPAVAFLREDWNSPSFESLLYSVMKNEQENFKHYIREDTMWANQGTVDSEGNAKEYYSDYLEVSLPASKIVMTDDEKEILSLIDKVKAKSKSLLGESWNEDEFSYKSRQYIIFPAKK